MFEEHIEAKLKEITARAVRNIERVDELITLETRLRPPIGQSPDAVSLFGEIATMTMKLRRSLHDIRSDAINVFQEVESAREAAKDLVGKF